MYVPCKNLGKKIASEVKEFLKTLDFQPVVYDILVGENEESRVYMETKRKIGAKLGVEVILENLSGGVETEELITYIRKLSSRDDVHGIMIERPLPKNVSTEIFSHINWKKDIDGQNPVNLGRIMYGYEELASSTAKSVAYFLDNHIGDLSGKKVCVINRSITVGRPLCDLLLNRNATVTICHSRTKNLKEITLSSDIVVVAVGKAEFLKEDMVKEGCVVVDVGTNVVDGKLVGDVSPEVAEKAEVTPVPGGIGYITSRMIFRNLMEALKIQTKNNMAKL